MNDWKPHCLVLRVKETVTLKELRRAYRKLALELHPDKHNNSVQSKEQFQKLNESYRFLLAELKAGRKPAPAPPPKQDSSSPKIAPLPKRPTNYAKIWVHAAMICLLISGLSWIASPRREEAESPAGNTQRQSSFLPSEVPEAVSIPPKPLAKKPPLACEIFSELSSGTDTVSYKNLSEENCTTICRGLATGKFDLHCNYGGKEVYRRNAELAKKPAPRPAALEKPQAAPSQEKPAEFRSSCFFTSILPENPVAEVYPNETESSCSERCVNEVKAHPLDRVVKCSFAGREIVNYSPDPMASFLAKQPPEP